MEHVQLAAGGDPGHVVEAVAVEIARGELQQLALDRVVVDREAPVVLDLVLLVLLPGLAPVGRVAREAQQELDPRAPRVGHREIAEPVAVEVARGELGAAGGELVDLAAREAVGRGFLRPGGRERDRERNEHGNEGGLFPADPILAAAPGARRRGPPRRARRAR